MEKTEAKGVNDELGRSPLEKRADELNVGRTGVGAEVSISESPIQEAKRLNAEMKQNLSEIRKERKELEQLMSAAVLSGKSLGAEKPKELTQEEMDEIKAKQFVKERFGI